MVAHRVAGENRKWCRRLSDLEVQDAPSGGLQCARLPAHRHGMERRHGGGTDGGLDHPPIVASRPSRPAISPIVDLDDRQGVLTLPFPDAHHELR